MGPEDEGELSRDEFVSRCIRDRDQMEAEFLILRPQYQGMPPALWVEELLGALGFKVCFTPMEHGELGLLDLENKHVFVNSRMEPGRRGSSELLRYSTLAHELAHVRLHPEELMRLRHEGDDGRRRRNREYEANLYAALFLVPRKDLERHLLAERLLEWRRDRRDDIESEKLWSAVYGLAKAFFVSPTLMMQCLVDFGWLAKERSQVKGRKYDLILIWSVKSHD